MIGYNILERENITEVLKNKPRWVTCALFAAGILLITLSAVSIGVVIGYTYCYIEHRSIIRSGNITQSTNFQILHMPLLGTKEAIYNKTINGAMSSIIISRLLKIGQAMMDEDHAYFPWSVDAPSPHKFD